MKNFSIKRVLLLIKKTWIENYRIWLLTLGVILFSYILFNVLTTDKNHIISLDARVTIYSFGLIIIGTIYANFLWRDFSSKSQSISFLLLPATSFEKLLTGVFYTVVLFPSLYISIFLLLDFVYIEYMKSVTTVKIDSWDLQPLSFSSPHSMVLSSTIIFLVIQPIALMSSLLFEKFSYIKTTLIVFVLFFLLSYISVTIKDYIFKGVIPDRSFGGSMFTPTEIYINNTNQLPVDIIKVPSPLSNFINITLTLGISLFFTLITFLKLKEKEI